MTQTWKVIYENGVFRPLEPVNLPEFQVGTVSVAVEKPQEEEESKTEKSAYDIFLEMGVIGMIKDAPPDLSTNQKYMEGFGEDALTDPY